MPIDTFTDAPQRRITGGVDPALIGIALVTAAQPRPAREPYRDFGKGMGDPAQLNFG